VLKDDWFFTFLIMILFLFVELNLFICVFLYFCFLYKFLICIGGFELFLFGAFGMFGFGFSFPPFFFYLYFGIFGGILGDCMRGFFIFPFRYFFGM
jgi:hypothetical protein